MSAGGLESLRFHSRYTTMREVYRVIIRSEGIKRTVFVDAKDIVQALGYMTGFVQDEEIISINPHRLPEIKRAEHCYNIMIRESR